VIAVSSTVRYVEGVHPGYVGRITQLHGEYYTNAWGPCPRFETLVARELADLCDEYDSDQDLLLTAHADGVLVGSIAIMGPRDARDAAQLRFYILDERYQGRGIGRTLLERALGFCRERGYRRVSLWTVEGLPRSFRLYESAGFRVVERVPDERYTVPRVALRMELTLGGSKRVDKSVRSG
jgi:GNAT superfamily N-acetyltransferase